VFGLTALVGSHSLRAGAPLAVGDVMRDFTLSRLDGQRIHLADLTKQGPVVVLMLRGWVGYQCPICTKQVGDYLRFAKDFQTAGANVVMIYPGAVDTVQGKAEDFMTGKTIPDKFHFVVDPDLKTVVLYDLRWDAPNETAYPSTFVFDRKGVTRYAKISHSHGDRSTATEVLGMLRQLH
jgi:peroxiredoxin